MLKNRQKKVRPERRTQKADDYLSSGCKAVAAIDRAIVFGLEGYLGGFAAAGTDHVEHFSVSAIGSAASGVLAGIPARFAALGFIGEAFFCIKFLFGSCEKEFGAAVFAN